MLTAEIRVKSDLVVSSLIRCHQIRTESGPAMSCQTTPDSKLNYPQPSPRKDTLKLALESQNHWESVYHQNVNNRFILMPCDDSMSQTVPDIK